MINLVRKFPTAAMLVGLFAFFLVCKAFSKN